MERLTRRELWWGSQVKTDKAVNYKVDEERRCVTHEGSTDFLIADRLAEYEDLEEQGKLLKLPCAVGDTVYRIDDGEIYEQVVRGILFRENKILAQDGNGSILGELCKDVFLAKSEAEQKLRQLENKGSD